MTAWQHKTTNHNNPTPTGVRSTTASSSHAVAWHALFQFTCALCSSPSEVLLEPIYANLFFLQNSNWPINALIFSPQILNYSKEHWCLKSALPDRIWKILSFIMRCKGENMSWGKNGHIVLNQNMSIGWCHAEGVKDNCHIFFIKFPVVECYLLIW